MGTTIWTIRTDTIAGLSIVIGVDIEEEIWNAIAGHNTIQETERYVYSQLELNF